MKAPYGWGQCFFFSREPRKSAREQFRKSVREHFASARERLKKSCPLTPKVPVNSQKSARLPVNIFKKKCP